MRAPFCLSHSDAVAALVSSAGFKDVAIAAQVGEVRFPSTRRFVRSFVGGSPLAAHVPDAVLECLTSDLKRALRGFEGYDGLAFPITAQLLAARPQ